MYLFLSPLTWLCVCRALVIRCPFPGRLSKQKLRRDSYRKAVLSPLLTPLTEMSPDNWMFPCAPEIIW